MDKKDVPRYIPTNHVGLIRDTESNAILSTDNKELKTYRERARLLKKTQNKIESINIMKEDLNGLKDEMAEIKNLLGHLISSKENM